MADLNPDVCVVQLNPRLEGANIRTWIGFKHLMYLAEDAVLAWFRRLGYGPQRLFHECGVSIDFTGASVMLPNLLEIDDGVVAESRPIDHRRFSVRMRVQNGNGGQIVLAGKIGARLVREPGTDARASLPDVLVPFLASDDEDAGGQDLPRGGDDAAAVLSRAHGNAFYWPWRARYFHCQYSERLQHSAYVRALEEVVDRFLVDRGLGIQRMLAERALIPVVSRVRVQVLASARMDDTMHTTFAVNEVLKEKAFDGQMDCYVERGDTLVHVATARILHGYAVSAGASAGQLAVLDDEIVASLEGRPS